MLRDTTESVYRGEMPKAISTFWFEGVTLVLGDINSVLNDVLDLCETPLKSVQKGMTSGGKSASEGTPEAKE